MQCVEFETRLQDLLDQRRRIDDEPALREHIAQCAVCGELAAGMTLAVDAASRLPIEPMPLSLERSVLDAVIAPRPILRFPQATGWASIAAAAALVALVGVPLGYWIGQHSATLHPTTLDRPPLVRTESPNHPASEPPADASAASPDQPLAIRIQEQLASSGFGAQKSQAAQAPASSAGHDTAGQGVPWSQEVREGLEPLTHGTITALNSLWEAIPPSGEDSRS